MHTRHGARVGIIIGPPHVEHLCARVKGVEHTARHRMPAPMRASHTCCVGT